MIQLLGAILCNAVFGQSYKLAVAREHDVDWVSLLSFASSSLAVLPQLAFGRGDLAWTAVALGGGFGLASGFAQVAFFRTLRYGPLSTSYAIVSLSTLVPALTSIVLWGERPSTWQYVAMGATVLAVLLMGDVELHNLSRPLAWAGWLALAYLSSGLSGVCMKAAGSLPGERSRLLFLLVGYVVSGILTGPLVRGRGPGMPELAVGAVRGLAIVLANLLLLSAIASLPGHVAFSAYGAGIVMVNVMAAVVLWHERPRGWAILGILLGIAAVVLFSL